MAVGFIVVRAGKASRKPPIDRQSEGRVALSEQHYEHPRTDEFPEGGEAFVAGLKPTLVAKTPEVVLRLRNETLEEVTDKNPTLKHQPVDINGNVVPISAATSPALENKSDGTRPAEDADDADTPDDPKAPKG